MQRSNPAIAKKYKGKKWQKVRELYLIKVGGICERCAAKGITKPAYIVHHKEYINESNYMDDDVFYCFDNFEALCLSCHNKETFANEREYSFDDNGDLICN